jgi:hypothetical protein
VDLDHSLLNASRALRRRAPRWSNSVSRCCGVRPGPWSLIRATTEVVQALGSSTARCCTAGSGEWRARAGGRTRAASIAVEHRRAVAAVLDDDRDGALVLERRGLRDTGVEIGRAGGVRQASSRLCSAD